MSDETLLQVKNLSTAFEVDDIIIPILKDVTLSIQAGESLGVVGESGSGKSVLAHAIMGLLPANARIYNGEIFYQSQNLLQLDAKRRRQLRGDRMAMIFQEPMTSLNPVYTVGRQVMELIRTHRRVSKKAAFEWSVDIFDKVGIPQPASFANRFPHELSGGMRQRVVIALAIALSPVFLVADEPTTALDVSIQAQILDLIKSLQNKMKMATMLITHDLGVVAGMCRRVLVMYAGQVVETGATADLFSVPKHPYTEALLDSIPKLEQDKEFLETINGMVPHPQRMPAGCRFAPRCQKAMAQCHREEPGVYSFSDQASVKCWLYQ